MISVLTIAGSDSSGGAGVQADIKAFSVLGVHGCSAVTCVTVQNTKNVFSVYPLPPNIIAEQIDTVVPDLKIKTVKTGMLYNSDIVKTVSKKIRKYKLFSVIDPVMISTTGKKLITKDYLDSLKKYLIPEAKIFMPNILEASLITRFKIKNVDDMKKACKTIHRLGCEYVLIKGGHLRKNCVDVLYDGKKFRMYQGRKIIGKSAHGSGCTYSALITGLIAKNYSVENAVGTAKEMISRMIEFDYRIGSIDIVNQNVVMNEKYHVLSQLKNVADWVESNLKPFFVPEVGINISYALPDAKNFDDVCGIDGRIVKVGGTIKRIGNVEYGKSKHVAQIVLTAMKFDPSMRCTMNIKYSESIVKKVKQKKLSIGFFERKNEPRNVSTMEWGSKKVIEKLGFVPDIIYDKGGIGKEAMIRVLGKNPEDVLKKLRVLIK